MTNKSKIFAAGLSGILLPQTSLAQTSAKFDDKASTAPASVRISIGANYSSGKYGDVDDTTVFSTPVSLTFKKGGLRVRASVPWVRVIGPGSLLQTPDGGDGGGGSGGTGRGRGRSGSGSGSSDGGSGTSGGNVTIGPTSLSGKRSGLGDVTLSLLYSAEFGSGFFLEPSVKVKLPTASTAKRLGTGKADFTMGADFGKDIGAASVYVHGRRKFVGKPTGSTLRSTWGAGGGVSVSASDSVSVGADCDWQQASIAGSGASSEVSGWVNFGLNRRLRLTLYAGTGLDDNSADLLGGASISFKF